MGQTGWALLAVNLVTLLAVVFLAGSLRRSDRSITLLHDELADLGHRLDRAEDADSVALGDASGLDPAGACRLCGRTDEQPLPGLPAPYLIGSPAGHPDRGEGTSVMIGEPLIKVAAFSFGVRRALSEEKRALIAYRVRRELKRRRGLRRGEPRRAA